MNKITLRFATIGALLCMGLFINGCQEVGPYVNLHNTATSKTYIETPPQQPEAKNVLIEVLTGVECNNCPPAHDALNNMILANNHIIGIEIHPGPNIFNLDHTPSNAKQDLIWADAATYFSAFAFPGYGPSGMIDRILHTNTEPLGNTSVWDQVDRWNTYASTEFAVAPPVNINLLGAYNSGMKQFNISVILHYNSAAYLDTNRLSVYLTEDSIVTAQYLPNQTVDTNYAHMHILRASLTNPLGDNINAAIVPGLVDSVGYTFTLSPADSLWKPKNMNVVAFVHKYQNGVYNILQSKSIKIQ